MGAIVVDERGILRAPEPDRRHFSSMVLSPVESKEWRETTTQRRGHRGGWRVVQCYCIVLIIDYRISITQILRNGNICLVTILTLYKLHRISYI